jgi:hypothetical protein
VLKAKAILMAMAPFTLAATEAFVTEALWPANPVASFRPKI